MASDSAAVPSHIAIIMDGNGRWAKQRGLNRTAGHQEGLEAARRVTLACVEAKINTLTLFAFSTDNWSRPKKEVAALLTLLADGLSKHLLDFLEYGIQVRFIGDVSEFPQPVRIALNDLEQRTADCGSLELLIALNYSGRWDITEAVRQLADCGTDLSNISEQDIAAKLATGSTRLPDLLIRTSGELRLSNFMLWQSAYTELYFTDVLWPDFDAEELGKALCSYAGRERRFGNATEAASELA